MKKNARKRRKLQMMRLSAAYRHQAETHPGLVEKLLEIHRRANLIRERCYEVVDTARSEEERDVMETEACRAMWLRSGEKHLAYHPNRGIVDNDWMKGS